MPFTKQHSAYAWVVTCILFLINLTFHNLPLHSAYKIHQPFTDYFLRLPYSELLEKLLFRSRANRRLVFVFVSFLGHAAVRLCLPDLGLMLGHCGLCRHHIGLMLGHFSGILWFVLAFVGQE